MRSHTMATMTTMRGVALLAAVCVACPASAQQLDAAAVRAFADVLERSHDPTANDDAVAAIPREARAALLSAGRSLSHEEVDIALEEANTDTVALVAAAVRVLAEDRSDRAEALLRERFAARKLADHAANRGVGQRTLGLQGWPEVQERASRRARRAAIELLRTHPAHAAPLLVAWTGPIAPPDDLADAAAAALARSPTVVDRMRAHEHYRAGGRVAAARAVLDGLGDAAPPRTLARRELMPAWIAEERADLAAIEGLQPVAAGDSVDALVARLRLRQLQKLPVLDLARELDAAKLPHALPATVLGVAALVDGRLEEARSLLDRAAGLPGAGAYTASALSTLVTPTVVRERAGAELDDVQAALLATLRRADGIIAADESPDAVLLRGLRRLGWPEETSAAMRLQLDGVRQLAAELARSAAVHRMLLAALMRHGEPNVARELLAAAPASEVAADPRIVRLRAQAALALALELPDAVRMREYTAPFLEALGASGADADLAHLRGVLAWVESRTATDPAVAAAARSRANSCFAAAAQRLPFDRGAWAAASSARVVALAAGEPTAVDRRAATFERDENDVYALTPWVAAELRHSPERASKDALALLARVDSEPRDAELVLRSALAEARAAAGDGAATRDHAKRALALRTASPNLGVLVDRGIMLQRRIHWRLAANMRGQELLVTLRCELFALPELPSAARLEQLAKE
jgi:hypothetical protein